MALGILVSMYAPLKREHIRNSLIVTTAMRNKCCWNVQRMLQFGEMHWKTILCFFFLVSQ